MMMMMKMKMNILRKSCILKSTSDIIHVSEYAGIFFCAKITCVDEDSSSLIQTDTITRRYP